jgi:hypothetical protein
MNHFKLVHGTTAPTRYTKIVFVPGKDTKFVKQYQETEYVSRYTKLAAPPASWTPPAPPVEPLAVVQRTSTSGSTVLGSVMTGTLAEYTGGVLPVDEEYQWQRSDTGDGGWSGVTNWTDVNTQSQTGLTYTTIIDDNGKYLRFASKALDADDNVAYGSGNSVGPMTPAAITVSQATKISNGSFVNPPNVYDFDSVTPIPATFKGGFGTLTVQTRTQEYSGSTASWVNMNNWANSPVPVELNGVKPGTQIRAQSRTTDETGTTKTSNSPTPTIGIATEIGTLSLAPPNTSAAPNETILFDALVSGTSTEAMFIWSIRSGPGTITSGSNIGEQIDVTVNSDATTGSSIQVQCDCSDPSATDSPKSTIATIVVQEIGYSNQTN